MTHQDWKRLAELARNSLRIEGGDEEDMGGYEVFDGERFARYLDEEADKVKDGGVNEVI